MSYYHQTSTSSPPFPAPPSPLPPIKYDPAEAPAVVVLETAKEGLLRVKVEPDIMAYILYCHYDEFARIQQTYHVAITWSGMDNTVAFCSTSSVHPTQLHLAAQQFMSFYYHIVSNLVAAPMNGHVANITLHQYHRATYEVKKFHPKAMVKDIKSTGRIAIYCSVNDVLEAKRTFLSALNSAASSGVSTIRQKSLENIIDNNNRYNTTEVPPKSPQNFEKYKTLPGKSLREREFKSSRDNAFDFGPRTSYVPTTSPPGQQNYVKYNYRSPDHEPQYHDDVMSHAYGRMNAAVRHGVSEETASSNASSGYGSNNGTISHYNGYYETYKHRSVSDAYFENKHALLPPIERQDSLHRIQPGQRHTIKRHPQKQVIELKQPAYDKYYYDDIQHAGDPDDAVCRSRPCTQGRLLDSRKGSYLYHHDGLDSNSRATKTQFVIGDNSMPRQTRSLARLDSAETQNFIRSPHARSRNGPSPFMSKPSFIPELKSPFQFRQNHKKYFEVTTPTDITIEVYEGDITDTDCDVIVNETNSQLHVTGELAWAVAKYGSFEIPKLTKLHVAMNGHVVESKVMVTPSVGLSSLHIIHAVSPKWRGNDIKRSRKLLYNTYKNIFNFANVELRATSIALPVIGLEKSSNSSNSYPFHVATEIMYQALVAFLKLGSPSIRHIRYIDNDPDHVNLIVTSIKPKIENVTYDARFLRQNKSQSSHASLSNESSDDVSGSYSNMLARMSNHNSSSSCGSSKTSGTRTLPNKKKRSKCSWER